MKRILLTGAAALALVGTASAADLAVKAPVAYVPVFTWTGCYLGANGGWIGSDESYVSHADYGPYDAYPIETVIGSYNTYAPKGSGGTFGGQFGCNQQFGNWVIGGEWDWNWTGLREANTYFHPELDLPSLGDFTQFTHKEVDWFATARARLGFTWDRLMVYATGGLAYAGFDAYTLVAADDPAVYDTHGGYHKNRIGWTAGGGIEWAFANNWTAKAEFLYLDFGSFQYKSYFDSPLYSDHPTDYRWVTDVDAKEYVARIGINRLFHTGGGPVVARY